jgi:phage gp46-like protein
MGAALQIINAFKQNITGGAFEPLSPGTGDSFTVQNVPQSSETFLAEVWAVDDASAAEIFIKASRFHDQQFAIRMQVTDGSALAPVERASLLLPSALNQALFPSDVLDIEVNGTNADNVNVTLLVYYSDLPGISARLASYETVQRMQKNLVGINVPLTPGTGDWGTGAALNSADNRLHANTDYAVLGFTSDLPATAVALSGIDTGNQRVGGPVLGDAEHDCNMFVDLARKYNSALIPIINSNNAGAITLQAASPSGTPIALDVMLAELGETFTT